MLNKLDKHNLIKVKDLYCKSVKKKKKKLEKIIKLSI